MTDRIDAGVPIQPIPTGAEEANRTTGAAGNYRGQQVTQKADVMSLIADAAEELSFVASEKVEKKLAKRKIGKRPGMKSSAMERAEYYIKKLPDMGRPEKLQQFLDHVKKQGAMSPRQFMQEAGKFFKDISHQYAALSYAEEMLEQEGGREELTSSLKAALDECMRSNGPEIRSGMNVTDTARGFSDRGFGDVQGLRDFYRDTVLQYEGLNETYRSLLEKYGESGFIQARDFLIKAVGADLQSQGSSISPVELKRVMDDLYQLEVIGNLREECSGLIRKMQEQFSMAPQISSQGLMDRIMGLKDQQFITGGSVTDIVRSMGIRDIEAQISFLREFKNLVREIPLKAYSDTATREKLLDAVQEALDSAIEIEEEGQ